MPAKRPPKPLHAAPSRGSARRPTAVYAGSFDPVTLGHMWMIREGARLFDSLVVAVGINPNKKYTFSVEDRMNVLRRCTKSIPNICVDQLDNQFLVDYARSLGAPFILRGIRNPHDYEYERRMRQVNGDLNPAITSVFLMPPRNLAELSSNFVKGLVGPIGWEEVVHQYLPAPAFRLLLKRFGGKRAKSTKPGNKRGRK